LCSKFLIWVSTTTYYQLQTHFKAAQFNAHQQSFHILVPGSLLPHSFGTVLPSKPPTHSNSVHIHHKGSRALSHHMAGHLHRSANVMHQQFHHMQAHQQLNQAAAFIKQCRAKHFIASSFNFFQRWSIFCSLLWFLMNLYPSKVWDTTLQIMFGIKFGSALGSHPKQQASSKHAQAQQKFPQGALAFHAGVKVSPKVSKHSITNFMASAIPWHQSSHTFACIHASIHAYITFK